MLEGGGEVLRELQGRGFAGGVGELAFAGGLGDAGDAGDVDYARGVFGGVF